MGLCYGQRSVCRLKPCVVGLGGCLPLSDVLQTLVSSGPSSFLLVNFWVVIYLLGCLLCCRAGKGVVMNVHVGGCEEVGRFFDWVPCLISFWLADILLGVLLSFSLFLGSSFLWCCFLPFFLLPLALRRRGGIVVDWCSGRTKSSTSSQGGHPSPSRSPSPAVPPFFRRRGAWEACSLFEPPLVSR